MGSTGNVLLVAFIGVSKNKTRETPLSHPLQNNAIGDHTVSSDDTLPFLVLGNGRKDRSTHIRLPEGPVTIVVPRLPFGENGLEVYIVFFTKRSHITDRGDVDPVESSRNHLRQFRLLGSADYGLHVERNHVAPDVLNDLLVVNVLLADTDILFKSKHTLRKIGVYAANWRLHADEVGHVFLYLVGRIDSDGRLNEYDTPLLKIQVQDRIDKLLVPKEWYADVDNVTLFKGVGETDKWVANDNILVSSKLVNPSKGRPYLAITKDPNKWNGFNSGAGSGHC